MAPKPIDNKGQVQRLTTALKNICRDYPAGGTVLRELLQNADDAGATELRFVLDETNYPVDELIHPELGQYQSAALLAFNNAVFTDKDFESLSRLGDSLKHDDASTTGKFGRGFNSVYNWTDSPSIISRDRFLILDPHLEWSSPPGGPVYNFVADAEDLAIKNHMQAFQTVVKDFDRPLHGTVIRLPLRTRAQAAKSAISNRETTVSDVLKVFQIFTSEFGDRGLLFMRNVEKLKITSIGLSTKVEMMNRKATRLHKAEVNNAVKSAFNDPGYSFDYSFELGIECRSTEGRKETRFLINHYISPMDNSLRDWANGQTLIPWVAIAAQIPIQSSEANNGSLFTVLPLPVATNQPVHIHGIFSITPDRVRLYQLSDKTTQDQDPAKWNEWLFRDPIPKAWTKLLQRIAVLYPKEPAFARWPQSVDDSRDLFFGVPQRISDIIKECGLAVWQTDVGYRSSKDAMLGIGVGLGLKLALQEAGAPILYVPQRLRPITTIHFRDQVMCRKNLCQFLHSVKGKLNSCSEQTRLTFLDYLLEEPEFNDYGGLELFPFKDGHYRSAGETLIYVHRDELEGSLFSLEDHRNIDLDKLSETAQGALKHECDINMSHGFIRYRSALCLKEFCMRNIFKDAANDQDMVVLDEEAAALITSVWKWISSRQIPVLSDDLSTLWLLPLRNGYYRKLQPVKSCSETYLAPKGVMGNLMRKLEDKMSEKLKWQLIDIGPKGLTPDTQSIVTQSPGTMSKLRVRDASDIVVCLEWLQRTYHLFEMTDEEKVQIAQLAASHWPQTLNESQRGVVVGALSHLPLFRKVSWKADEQPCTRSLRSARNKPKQAEDKTLTLVWTTLDSCSKSIGLLDGVHPVPEIEGVQFLTAPLTSSSNQLLQQSGLAECLSSVQVIQYQLIPAWTPERARNWHPSCKEKMAEFILGHFSSLSLESQAKVGTIPIVPVAQLNGKDTSKFALAKELIDPSVPELKRLCFDEEEIIPKPSFQLRFDAALKGCGLKVVVDEAVVEHRVTCYASSKYPYKDVAERARKLLGSSCRWSTPLRKQGSNLRSLEWIPTVNSNREASLKASPECRSCSYQFLVNSRLPILGMLVSPEWEHRLGWDIILPSEILLSQLSMGVQNNQKNGRQIVDAVLTYISEKNLTEGLVDKLLEIPCVLVTSNVFVTPSHAIRPVRKAIESCQRLQPYLANVDNKFWKDHLALLTRLKIGEKLQPADLLKVQAILEAKPELEESDVVVAIEIATLASAFPRNLLEGLKVLSGAGTFHSISDIYFDDLGALKSTEKVNVVHPGISKAIVLQLGISGLKERMLKGMLQIEDDDEDEFEQREDVITRISDTLDRYPVETTFREYLANADDTDGASKISWLLDERVHASVNLVAPEMSRLQGQSLLVYNDGVFSDHNFNGFKHVGEGSKAQDSSSTGQFGRGSQTMYHWTDSPMILSGRWLVILDPQQEVLPRNSKTGKPKAGVKLDLSKIRNASFGDQLAPFEGLWGFDKNTDNYPGTIFRFPLRTNTKSALKTNKQKLKNKDVCDLMDKYFDEARISLLFLRRIKSIEFSVYGNPYLGWSVNRHQPLGEVEDQNSFSEHVICRFKKYVEGIQSNPVKEKRLDSNRSKLGKDKRKANNASVSGKDTWWVAIEDLENLPEAIERLPDSTRRAKKNVRCGFAALIEEDTDKIDSGPAPLEVVQSRLFNTLPLPFHSELPVHVNATFSLSGDRQSIAIDEYSKAQGSEWNRYLLQEVLPKLYFSFLEDIASKIRQRAFNFWPQKDPPERSCAELLCQSFWEKLPQSSERLFPKAQLPLPPGGSRRRAQKNYDISKAVFDFLPKTQSAKLAPLLLALSIDLVREIPTSISKHLKELSGVKFVTSEMLRSLFKSAGGRICLQTEMAKDPLVLEELFSQVVPLELGLEDLNGCHLPLADGTLATLKYAESEEAESSTYYVASEKELKLFEFASELLVSRVIITSPVIATKLGVLLESGKYNLTKLRLCHVKKLLDLRPPASTPNKSNDQWLTDFWKFWNDHVDYDLSSSTVHDFSTEIFGATVNGTRVYQSPTSFHMILPAVVLPSVDEHKKLCSKIPGLYQFKPDFLPKSLMTNERSFYNKASFCRFIAAIRKLSETVGIQAFVESHLHEEQVKALRGLAILHLDGSPTLEDVDGNLLDLRRDLSSLPLWPVFNSKELLSADNALMATNRPLLVPWMRNANQFVDPQFSTDPRNQNCLLKLGVQKQSNQELLVNYVLPTFPSTLSKAAWSTYMPLISAIADTDLTSSGALMQQLKQARIAADGARTLRPAGMLYDHTEPIFVSAFRQQAQNRFLHGSVQGYRDFWLLAGLRHQANGRINPQDYVICLQALGARLNTEAADDVRADPELVQDSQTVLSPLTTQSYKTNNFGVNDWHDVAQQRVFLAKTSFNAEPDYRRNTMASVASRKKLLCLADVVALEHVAVCWSQTSFVTHQPAREVLSKFSGNGQPTVNMVWEHLYHLRSMADELNRDQVFDFLADLDLTYDYLQNHLDRSRLSFNLRNSPVWLNLNTVDYRQVQLEDIESSWQPISALVLSSSCDAGPVKAVRPGLMRFEKLLRGLDCNSIVHPTVTRPPVQSGTSLANALRKLRDEEKLLDVTFSTEGRLVKAHKTVLAAISEKCASHFSGRWCIEGVISCDDSTDPDGFLSYHTLSTMVDYAYEGDIDWSSMQVSSSDDEEKKAIKLRLLLDLHRGADYWRIPALASQVEGKILDAGREFINLENVLDIKERAEMGRAIAVERFCAEFIQENRDAVDKAHSANQNERNE